MFKRLLPGLVVAAIVLGLVIWRPWADPSAPSQPHTADSAVSAVDRAPTRSNTDDAPPPRAAAKKTKVSPQERTRYRRAIQRAIRERAQQKKKAKAPAAPQPTANNDDDTPPHEGLKDRSGGKLARLMKDLHRDVMPLADECYEQALERDPTVAGSLNLQFEVIGDQDVGGLVESVELEESSEIQDPEMVECIRETLLSTIFPAPDDSGATGVRLTLGFEPE